MNPHPHHPRPTALLALAVAAFAGSQMASAQTTLYGIGGTDTGAGPNAAAYRLFTLNTAAPTVTSTIGTVTPSTGFSLMSIAVQPSTGNLYGFQYNGTNQGQLVTISTTNAALTPVGSPFTIGSITSAGGDNTAAISFNPTNGAVRLITGTFGNYRVNAATGALLGQDTSVSYAAGDPNAQNTPQISAVAYNGGTLYDVDYAQQNIATQNLAAGAGNGTLTTVGGPLFPNGGTGTQGASSQGFTIANGIGYLNSTTSVQGGAVQDHLFSVSLTGGTATDLGLIGNNTTFNTVDLAAFVVPEPGTYALCLVGLGAVTFGVRRRRLA